MTEAPDIRRRAAIRDAVAARTRTLTAAVLALSAVLSGLFAGIAGASAPGHKLSGSAAGTQATKNRHTSAGASTAIPPLPAAPGPGNISAAAPPAPTPAPAPSSTPAAPAVVSGGS